MKKNVFLILVFVLCLTLCSVSLAASEFKDVKGTKYEDAVKNLVDIGLVNGYAEDNTYRPSNAVTRAEMAKLMVIALGEEGKLSTAKQQKNVFTDIKTEHWAYGYINIAKDLKIINGYPDGRFAPEDTVTYAEAVTMVTRALGYDVEVEKSTETWPNNYITQAKKLSLLSDLGTFKNDDGAKRGDIANLVWKSLRTGVCTAKSQTAQGGITYGEGQKMLNKYKNYTYLEDATITSVEFSDDWDEAKVTITDNEDKLTVTMSSDDVLAYYGRKIDLLYKDSNKKFSYINIVDKYKKEKGEITDVTSKKIWVDDEDYERPDKENILLYDTEDLDSALEATLIFDGKTLKYIIASGAIDVDVGLVTSSDVTVSKKDGIKMKKLGSSSTLSYALIDEDDMPEEESVILYHLNSDDELGIVKEISIDDADEISSLSSTKIKVNGKTYTYDEDDFIIISATSSTIKTLDFKKIDEDEDMVYVYTYSGKTYVVVFIDSVIDDNQKDDYYDELQDYIKKSEKISESSYSQSTYGKLLKALDKAKKIKSSSKATEISSALSDLKSAYNGLSSVKSSSTEGKIAKARSELRALVNGSAATAVSNKSKYTSASYSTFSTALTKAETILERTNTDEDEVNTAYKNLNKAIEGLVLLTNDSAHKDAVSKLDAAIAKADKITDSSTYTSASWNTFKSKRDTAKSVKNNAATKTASDIQKAADDLEAAIKALEPAISSYKQQLEDLILDYEKEHRDDEDTYMKDSYESYKDALDSAYDAIDSSDMKTIQNAINELKKAESNLILVSDEIKEIRTMVNKMGEKAISVESALSSAEADNKYKEASFNNIITAAVTDLNSLLTSAKEKVSLDTSSLQLITAYAKANTVHKKYTSTKTYSRAALKEISDAYATLNSFEEIQGE